MFILCRVCILLGGVCIVKAEEKKKVGTEGRLRLAELAEALPEYKLKLLDTFYLVPSSPHLDLQALILICFLKDWELPYD